MFLGAPVARQDTEVTLEIDVLNGRRARVRSYTATGRGDATAALYWGYSPMGSAVPSDDTVLFRAAHALAVRDALNQIVASITTEAGLLREELDR